MQGAWFAAALLASGPWHGVGALANVVVLALHLAFSHHLSREVLRAAAALSLGVVVELIDQHLGWVEAKQATWFPPWWLLSLWPVFASAMMRGQALEWLTRRPVLAAVLGAVAGPLSYSGGARLGALELHGVRSLVTIGVCWAVAMPLLTWLARALEPER